MNRIAVALVALSLAACAQLKPGLRVKTLGEADLNRDAKIATESYDRRDVPDVTISDSIPEGLELQDGGRRIAVKPGYEARYEILGVAEADYLKDVYWVMAQNWYWVWNYDEGWRKGLCWPQAPLKAVSLGIWNVVPTAWPCMVKMPDQAVHRQNAMQDALKKVAAGMGGNLVVLSDASVFESSDASEVRALVKDTNASAFVIKETK